MSYGAIAAGLPYTDARCLLGYDDQGGAVAGVTVWSARSRLLLALSFGATLIGTSAHVSGERSREGEDCTLIGGVGCSLSCFRRAIRRGSRGGPHTAMRGGAPHGPRSSSPSEPKSRVSSRCRRDLRELDHLAEALSAGLVGWGVDDDVQFLLARWSQSVVFEFEIADSVVEPAHT